MSKYVFDKTKIQSEGEIEFCTLDKITQQTEDEYLLRFCVPINHDPGQFMQCSVLGIGEAPISFCSYDNEYFEMSVRGVGNVSHAICSLDKGDRLGLRGPYGRGYPMDQFEGKDLIIIGGGCGVAPLRGIIEYLEKYRDKFGTVNNYFGFRTGEDVLFGEDFSRWQDTDMQIDLAFSDEDRKGAYKGYVTDIVDSKPKKSRVVFICGPPIMIKVAVEKLLKTGFDKSQIWISEERHMKCGVGRCGHCMIKGKYCCTDGPVFRYDELY